MKYFVLISIRKLEYNYCCVVAILISFYFISFLFIQGVYLHIFIYVITMPVNLSQYLGIVGTFNNCYAIRFRNNYQHFKYYLKNIHIAFGVISFSCSILTNILLFFLSLSFEIFVCNSIKILQFSRFRKIKGVVCQYI